MDPVTAAVVAAIASAMAAGATDVATETIKDAYATLKNILVRKYSGVDVTALERKPDSEPKKDSLAEDLDDAGAAGDPELGTAAVAVLEAVQQHAPQVVNHWYVTVVANGSNMTFGTDGAVTQRVNESLGGEQPSPRP
ncbi:hypothetical protein [Nocardia salmonicida]|uniref:hypothetical protein n=1 Tax=Nocardia salmonicida TaxID=53431 RepID=UPI0037BCFD42